ncbi:hypothetical protein JTB14_023384 [Gonioctena quinquepunctata]|nr:hypothetical protein JTB14_023384 [Gonioctena quinquepunctata]
MWRIFCFLITLILLVELNESLPPSTRASTGITHPHNEFQIEEHKESKKESIEEFPIKIEEVNKTASIEKDGTAEHPVLTQNNSQYVEEKSEMDKVTFEMLKQKCKHFQSLLKTNNTNGNFPKPPNYRNPDVQLRPVYVTPRPTSKPSSSSTSSPNGFYISNPSTSSPNGFYITAQPTSGKPSVNIQTSPPIKYIRLEPVILQKTILSDGRTVYYWHRSLPTAVEYPANQPPASQFSEGGEQHQLNYPSQAVYGYAPQNQYVYPSNPHIPTAVEYPAKQPSATQFSENGDYPSQAVYGYPQNQYVLPSNPHILSSNSYYYPVIGQDSKIEVEKESEHTTEIATSSTTEESYGYGFSNFIPFYSSSKGDSTTTTAEPTTSTAPPKPPTDKVLRDNLMYAQQLKFIVPVPYDGSKGMSQAGQQPWGFDQWAYYPKELQPNTVNVRVPYSPTFHMIRAVTVPKIDDNVHDRSYQTDINE